MTTLLIYTLIAGVFSLIGGLALLIHPKLTQRLLTPLVSFAAGAFLAAAFLDIIPHALEHSHHPKSMFQLVLVGFILFFIIERFIMAVLKVKLDHHHPNHSDHTESLPFLIIAGDSIHNFLDGIVLALAYVVDPHLALPTALAIAAHEIPQEIGDFAVLLKLNWSKKSVIVVNLAQSLLTIPGAILGYYLAHSIEAALTPILAITGGVFVYLGASSLIPEVHHQAGHKRFFSVVFPLIAAVVIVGFLGSFAHQFLPDH